MKCQSYINLVCTLSPDELHRMCNCSRINEILDILGDAHKGTNQEKESKINILTHQYELQKWRMMNR